MREMKDSGVQWIGAIPVDWKIDNPKYHFTQRKDRAKPGMVQLTASQKYGVITQTEYMERTGANIVTVEKDFDILKLVRAGDFVIHMRSFQGGLEYSEKTGSTSSAYVMLIPHSTICEPRYYKWFFKSSNYIDALSSTSNLVRDGQAMRWANFIQLPIPFPPASEQRHIADFLDTKCAEIDALTADIQTQIDTLEQYKRSVITETVTKGLNPDVEMKDSGIQWIGNMPAHWDVIRGKYILRYMQKPVREDDGVITCFRDGEVTLRSNRREDGFTMSDKEIGYQGIDVGDLVVHGMDGFAGSIGISDSRGKASPVLNVLDTDQCKRYIMYYLRSMAYSDVFLALATGIRVRSCDLRWNKLAELSYPVPPLDEQNAIVKHIDSVLSKADAVIADKKAQLATLDEYKKSLIFEYVTGKKEVPTS
jgi:type I restriction enzyme S subunit